MNDKPVLLLIEDKQDTSFKEKVEEHIDLNVRDVAPPTVLLDLQPLVIEQQADAVVLDQVLQHHSDVTYMGSDGFEFLRNAFPSLPLYILTDRPPGPELNELPTGNLIRRNDFFDDQVFQKTRLQELYQAIQSYRQGQKERQERKRILRELWHKAGITQEAVSYLAQLHFEADHGIEQIIWIPHEKEIRLLEVNRTAIPSGSVLVFPFAPSFELPFPMLIADITPTEWKQLRHYKMPLPEGWDLETAQIFQRFEYSMKGA